MAPTVVLRDDDPRMSDDRPSEVLGGLRHTRPHRRSEKRAAPAAADAASDMTSTAVTADIEATGAEVPSPPPDARPAPAARETRPAPSPTARAARPATPIAASRARPAAPAAAPGATKRATRSPSRVRQPAQPPGTPPAPSRRGPTPATGVDLLGSAVHVTAELAEIGISAGARALRGVVARLPRP
jgi:hypothetical protein